MIGDILDRWIGNTFWSSICGRVARSHWRAQRGVPTSVIAGASEVITVIERAKPNVAEVKLPETIVALVQSDQLASQHFADKDLLGAPSDLAGLAHFADLPMIR